MTIILLCNGTDVIELSWLMISSSLRILGLNPLYDQRRRHQRLSTAHGCRPSWIELFR